MDQFPEFHERVTAGRLLSTGAAHISKNIDSFCSWLLMGVGAAYALILANFASLTELVAPRALQISLLLLLAAIILGVIQRWLAAIVATSTAAGEKAEQIGKELSERNIPIDFKIVFREMERGIYYPTKLIFKRSVDKAMSGDFSAAGRFAAAFSQIQSWLAFLLVSFVVAAIAVTACAIKV